MENRVIAVPGGLGECEESHRWKVLGVGFAANASFSAAFSGIPTTAVFLRSGYHLGNDGLGLVLGMLGLGIAVSELPWGLLTDRWGDRRVLLLGLLSTAAALAGLALFVAPSGAHVPSVTMLALGLLLVGLLGGSVNGSSGRAVMAWFREGQRGLAMSIRQTALPAGGGLGALVLPALASRFGFAPPQRASRLRHPPAATARSIQPPEHQPRPPRSRHALAAARAANATRTAP